MRFFYVVVSDGTNLFTVFAKTKGSKYINAGKIKNKCQENNKFIDKDKLIIINIIEFANEKEMDEFIT